MNSIEDVLTKKGIDFEHKGSDYLVKCFNPEHDDSSPSMRIDMNSGAYHCFSCGYKGNLLRQFAISHVTNHKITELKDRLSALRLPPPVGYCEDAVFNVESFRGLKKETIDRFEMYRSEEVFPDRVVIPLYDLQGRIVANLGRYERSDVSPKYMMKPDIPAPWMPIPEKCNFVTRVLVLVEGPMDVINLYDKGNITNAVAVMGSKTVNRENIYDKLLPYMVAGVQKVIIAFDGDSPGRSAADYINQLINYNTPLVSEVYSVPEGKDPGSMSAREIERLKNQFTTH